MPKAVRNYFVPRDELAVSGAALPHWEQPGKTYFITFHVADSIPAAVRRKWASERERWFAAHPEPRAESDLLKCAKVFA